jgi:hypothetical protein
MPTIVDHALAILDCLQARRSASGQIAPIRNVELMRTIGRDPGAFGVIYGQANSLIDHAALLSDLPLIGRLVVFDRPDESLDWPDWKDIESLVCFSAPRLKHWTAAELTAIRQNLQPGSPTKHWDEVQKKSNDWRARALAAAQAAVREHARFLTENSSASD